MSATDYWIRSSGKTGLASKESYIVGRGNQVYLRILGKEPAWQIMTATASEDDGKLKVIPQRIRLVETAFKIGHRRNTQPIPKKDLKGREYVLICSLNRADNETDEEFDKDLAAFTREFFDIFDQHEEVEVQARDEMIDIYQLLSDDNFGEDVYLSDGLWLSSDGSVADRGR